MRLSEIMSNAGLMTFAEIGLVMFVLIFLGAVAYTFLWIPNEVHARDAALPLQPDPTPSADEQEPSPFGGTVSSGSQR